MKRKYDYAAICVFHLNVTAFTVNLDEAETYERGEYFFG